MTLFPAEIEEQAAKIIALYKARRLMLSTAESCTGGLIAGALTEISGSSAVVDRGFVTYTNEAKVELLGVSKATLAEFGAVSKETALQMAHAALYRSRANVAVAVTGIAGPTGGSAEKPVGLVHLAVKSRAGEISHREMRYGDIGRSEVRLATVATALEILAEASQAGA
ncbi:nicotinamide-nucleotide amidase [Pseudorhizobium tarimense]|uniref:Nicotinamide-nucleotide amidase n=1 Tax=Pseudorhizobium tarimense TaxID=1079109 RepID=A0ABV2HA49_9HYPH|nr:CinA family protein [Pseudorhizobium tarimense]MCJ8520562.1 CinA family protein [Pseudorhizobium tarimense]